MGKSYSPLHPKRTRRAPKWATLKDERVIAMLEIHTDDTQFGRGLAMQDRSEGITRYATRRSDGRWEEFKIKTSRILRRIPEQKGLFVDRR